MSNHSATVDIGNEFWWEYREERGGSVCVSWTAVVRRLSIAAERH